MTDVEQLMMQMEFSPGARRALAERLVKAERVVEVAKHHRRRLPHQVQTALREPVRETELGAPMPGAPDLFHQGRPA